MPKAIKKEQEAVDTSAFVTKQDFDTAINAIVSILEKKDSKVETAEEKMIDIQAQPSGQQAPKEWVDVAMAIIGEEYVDHCEMHMPEGGGVYFTVVIKPEKSNMTNAHREFYKTDRRTKAINNGGIEAVKQYCKAVRQNLKKSELI